MLKNYKEKIILKILTEGNAPPKEKEKEKTNAESGV